MFGAEETERNVFLKYLTKVRDFLRKRVLGSCFQIYE
jgi:hypothetical protein